MYQNCKPTGRMLYLPYANSILAACNSQMYKRNILSRNINKIIAPKLFKLQRCFHAFTHPFEWTQMSAEPE